MAFRRTGSRTRNMRDAANEDGDDKPLIENTDDDSPEDLVSLERLLAKEPEWKRFELWLIGDTPLITHAWSEKAKLDMLDDQKKIAREKTPRDPEADFVSSLYELRPGSQTYGFPATGIKDCVMSVAHKDRGVPQTVARANTIFKAPIYQVRAAQAGAKCNMPLVRIWGGEPVMREDMVRVGVGMRKTATLAYRAEFWPWAIKVRGVLNVRAIPTQALLFLARHAGITVGIGDWRNAKKGVFGAFHIANPEEVAAWEAYRKGGALPEVEPWGEDDEDDMEEAA